MEHYVTGIEILLLRVLKIHNFSSCYRFFKSFLLGDIRSIRLEFGIYDSPTNHEIHKNALASDDCETLAGNHKSENMACETTACETLARENNASTTHMEETRNHIQNTRCPSDDYNDTKEDEYVDAKTTGSHQNIGYITFKGVKNTERFIQGMMKEHIIDGSILRVERKHPSLSK